MNPDRPIVTFYTISMDEWKNIFPWFENLSETPPPKKRGRKPKAHQVKDISFESKPAF